MPWKYKVACYLISIGPLVLVGGCEKPYNGRSRLPQTAEMEAAASKANDEGESPPIGSDSTDAGKATIAFNKGVDFSNREDWDTAISCYSEAIRLSPDYAYAYYSRGYAHDEKGEYDLAIKDYTEAIRLKPDDAEAYFGRGLAYQAKGNKANAAADFAKAKELGYEP